MKTRTAALLGVLSIGYQWGIHNLPSPWRLPIEALDGVAMFLVVRKQIKRGEHEPQVQTESNREDVSILETT